MKKITLLALLISYFSIEALAQKIPSSVIVHGERISLYYISPDDLGYASNTLAVTNKDLYSTALQKGYKLCTPEIVEAIYAKSFNGTSDNSYGSVSICISYSPQIIVIDDVGKEDNRGKYLISQDRRGSDYTTFFDTKHKFMLFTR